MTAAGGARGLLNQVLMVILINIPTVSFGLALGWVSLASGEAAGGEEAGGEAAGRGAVVAAVTTFTASLAGVPLSAYALAAGRKLAIIVTSGCFVVCWSLKLASTWGPAWGGAWGGAACVVAARVAAGLGGAAAWALAPLLAREMCSARWRGAAVAALALAHNAGVLLMYLAADARLPHRMVLWCCLALSVVHFFVFFFMPESPSFLAAKGKIKEARSSLAWLRGLSAEDPALDQEMEAWPQPELVELSPLKLAKEMLSDPRRRRAFIIGGIAVVGQEACGVLAILQYAERVFVLARDAVPRAVTAAPALSATHAAAGVPALSATHAEAAELASPARHAVLLGAVQLAASALSLYLVEKIGRRPLIVWCAAGTGAALAAAAALVGAGGAAGGAGGAAVALAVAVAVDSAGLQPAPYSLLADMFHYEYRGCALMLITAAACAGNAVEVGVFPAAAAAGGLRAALALAAALTLAYALFALLAVPETKGRTPEEIYEILYPTKTIDPEALDIEDENKRKVEKVRRIVEVDTKQIENKNIYPTNTKNPEAFDMEDKNKGSVETVKRIVKGDTKQIEDKNVTEGVESDAVKVTNVSECAVTKEVSSKETWCTIMYNIWQSMGLLEKLSGWLGGGAQQATVLVLGLDNSGKSTLLHALHPPDPRQPQPQHPPNLPPTVAHQQDHFQSGGVSFRAWDVSGAARLRPLWERHYRTADAIIFVVDSADHLRLVVAREELELLVAHPALARRVPLLLLANKCDAPHALSAAHVAAALGLERITDKPWHICSSSGLSGAGLADGVAWLARQLRELKMRRH
ncbi:uncharacterized protein [Epargyreus clarus]|uniref:uncharacterized protein n=1 Tax=Epargyreus clarus TaxID=520877 RepID=UPI003C30452D